jgi:F0F1-type ATP synthase assembly protein I
MIEFVKQYPMAIFGLLGFCAGVYAWHRTDKKFKESQRGQRMFDEVNSKEYDEENIQ